MRKANHDTFTSCPVMRDLGFLWPFIAPIPISALACRFLTPLWPRSAILRGWFMLGAPVYRPRATCLCHSLRLVYQRKLPFCLLHRAVQLLLSSVGRLRGLNSEFLGRELTPEAFLAPKVMSPDTSCESWTGPSASCLPFSTWSLKCYARMCLRIRPFGTVMPFLVSWGTTVWEILFLPHI